MRTTLNIDDDVLFAVTQRARRQNRSTGEVLSELARKALLERSQANSISRADGFYGFEPLPSRGVVVSNELIDRLRENALG